MRGRHGGRTAQPDDDLRAASVRNDGNELGITGALPKAAVRELHALSLLHHPHLVRAGPREGSAEGRPSTLLGPAESVRLMPSTCLTESTATARILAVRDPWHGIQGVLSGACGVLVFRHVFQSVFRLSPRAQRRRAATGLPPGGAGGVLRRRERAARACARARGPGPGPAPGPRGTPAPGEAGTLAKSFSHITLCRRPPLLLGFQTALPSLSAKVSSVVVLLIYSFGFLSSSLRLPLCAHVV